MQLFNTRLIERVNPLLEDVTMGGSHSLVSGHALVFALHLQKELSSSTKLIQMLSNDQSTLVKGMPCVKPLQTLIQV